MPSISATVGSSMFGRFGRRHVTDTAPQLQQEIVQEGGANKGPPTESIPQAHPIRPATSGAHKRDSSVLSLNSIVSERGNNVRRSVSLHSHRTQASGSSGSASFGHAARVPSNGGTLSPPLTENEEVQALPAVKSPPRPHRALSVSAKSLSSKFRSAENLTTYNSHDRSEFASNRPTNGAENAKPTGKMMVVPPIPRRIPPDRPPPPSEKLSRDASHGSDGASLHHTTTAPAQTGSYNPRLVYQQIHQTSAKRMATIDYLRKVHEGNVYYFSTLDYKPSQLAALPSLQPVKMVRRANNYMVLGYSLPAVLEMNSGTPMEYLKAFLALLQEFETYQSLSGFDSSGSSLSRGRVGAMFSSMGLGNRSGKGRRSSTATDIFTNGNSQANADYLGLPRSATEATSPMETSPITPTGHEFQHLMTPHMPFDPDFHTTFATLCDALIDAYAKLLDLVSSPDQCAVGVGEAFNKADKHVRKILVANVVREFEDNSRSTVKGEVAGLGCLVLGGLA